MFDKRKISDTFTLSEHIVVYPGDCLELLRTIPSKLPRRKRTGHCPWTGKVRDHRLVYIIPNVKSNHVEKTDHPCQFPVELIERLVLSMTNEGDWVFDPFLGTGTSIITAIRHGRRGDGAEIIPKYVDLARQRIDQVLAGTLRTRPMDRPVYDPEEAGNRLRNAPWKKIQKMFR